MFDTKEFSRLAGISSTAIQTWTKAGWICPRQTRSGQRFSTIDLARVRLILDLRGSMGVNDEGISVILHLIDQIYALRSALHVVSSRAIRNGSDGRKITVAAFKPEWVERHRRKAAYGR